MAGTPILSTQSEPNSSGSRPAGDSKARWLGHKLRTEVDLAVDPALPVADADEVATAFETELLAHMPALQAAHIRVRPFGA